MDDPSTYKTANASIRRITPADINDEYLSWFKDLQVTEFLAATNISRDDALKHYEEGLRSETYYMYGVFSSQSGQLIGSMKLGPIDMDNRLSDLVVVIGNRNYWGKGIASEVISVGNRIGFEKLKMRKMSGAILGGNIGSIKAYTKAGWVIEGIQWAHFSVKNQLHDRVLVSCFNPEMFNTDALKTIPVEAALELLRQANDPLLKSSA